MPLTGRAKDFHWTHMYLRVGGLMAAELQADAMADGNSERVRKLEDLAGKLRAAADAMDLLIQDYMREQA